MDYYNEKKRPNILILHTDQQRYDSLGCTGGIGAHTPNIDLLAEDGVIFDRHMTGNPVCSPSRACLMTGMTVTGHGLTCNGMSLWRADDVISIDNRKRYKNFENVEMSDKVPTIADICNDSGYDTSAFGKLHIQSHLADATHNPVEAYDVWTRDNTMEEWVGPYYGFKNVRMVSGHGENVCRKGQGAHYALWLEKNYPDVIKNILNTGARKGVSSTNSSIYMSAMPAELHNSMWLANEFIDHISGLKKAESKSPFMAFIGFPDPHHPWTPPAEIAENFVDAPVRRFAEYNKDKSGKPESVVHEINRTYQSREDVELAYKYTLASVNLIDSAVGRIIDFLKSEDLYDDTIIVFTSDHGDYLGDFSCLTKSFLASRALNHVPLIIKPNKSAMISPYRHKSVVANYDVLPTVLALAGIESHDKIQGRNIFNKNRNGLSAYIASYAHNIRMNNLSLVDDTYRYTLLPLTGEEELYDHENDYLEEINLAQHPEYAGICKEFRNELGRMHMTYDLHAWGKYSLY